MTLPLTVIKGAIKVQGVPDGACFESFTQLLQALGQYLTVEIAASSISNVIISNVQPGALDKDKLWVRISNSGSFVGFLVYSGTAWVQVYPIPNQIFTLSPDSENPPPGFAFIDNADGAYTVGEYAALIAQYAVPKTVGTGFVIYPAKYTGI